MGSDIDFRQFNLLNLGNIDPVPTGLALDTDPRLSDARTPLAGSVTDASVAIGAAIDQSKLNLDGVIPPAWLGTTSTTAAEGDLAEYVANKDAPNGYAGLDGSGKIPAGKLPATTGTGTVTSVGLSIDFFLTVTGSPITTAGVFSVAWQNTDAPSWFGNPALVAAVPQFYSTPIPVALIPSLDASIVTTGIFAPSLLPIAVGLGVSHAPGAVPDPGDGTGGALATDYLARDMTYKAKPTIGPTYQPVIPDPTFSTSPNLTGPIQVVPQDSLSGVTFFYSLTSGTTGFQEFIPGTSVTLAPAATIWVYASRTGYTNSNAVNMTNPNP